MLCAAGKTIGKIGAKSGFKSYMNTAIAAHFPRGNSNGLSGMPLADLSLRESWIAGSV